MDQQLLKAIDIVTRLQEWIEDVDGLDSTPIAHLTWSDRTLEIGIGEAGLWSDQGDTDEELTFDELRARYIKHVENLALVARVNQHKPEAEA